MQCCEHFVRGFASFCKRDLPKHTWSGQNPTAMLLRPGCCGAGGSWAVQHISGALWAPPGAGCRHLSSQHGIYWPVSGNHEPLTVAQWGGPGIKSMVMDTSRHPALLFQPCKLKPSVTVMAFWERGCAAPTGGDRAQASWHWAALPSPSTENKGVTFLQAELDTFMACLGLVFSHSSHFFFTPSPVETCSFVIGRFIVFPSDISLIT